MIRKYYDLDTMGGGAEHKTAEYLLEVVDLDLPGWSNIDLESNLPEINPVSIVTVKAKETIYKNGEPALAIELIHLEENGFEIISQKGLYEIGDKAVYIIPDYSIPDTSLFESFNRPGGDEKKSKLGKRGRIKAIKFNFNKESSSDPIFSQGILLPYNEVSQYINLKYGYDGSDINEIDISKTEDLTKELEITKYETPDDNSGSGINTGASKPFPLDMYKTDETNYLSLKGHIQNKIGFPIALVGSMKVDGSSGTIWYKNGKFGIASRNLAKPLTIKKVVGYNKPAFFTRIKETLFWLGLIKTKPDYNVYAETESDSDFVRLGKPYLEKLVAYCKENKLNLALRGELNGQSLKGSGNKNNPNAKEEQNIKFFGVDDYTNSTIKLGEEEFAKIVNDLDLTRCPIIFNKEFNSLEEIEWICNEYFKENLIEGIVLRTLDSKFSCKFMNPLYDSKKD